MGNIRGLVVVTWLALLLCVTCAQCNSFSHGAERNFRVVYAEEVDPHALPSPPQGERITMQSATGKEYECIVPRHQDSAEGPKRRTLEDLREDVQQVLEEPDNCGRQATGWWTYQFCKGKDYRQFHVQGTAENPIFDPEYSLGKRTEKSPSDILSLELPTMHTGSGPAAPYYSEIYYDGALCDLTNQPSDPGKGVIASHLEPTSCQYQVNVNLPALCRIPEFGYKEKDDAEIILCTRVKRSQQAQEEE